MRLLFASLLLPALMMAASDFPIGSKISEITVRDGDKQVAFTPSKAMLTVVIFTSVDCPISNSYNERMNELYRDYSGKNIQLIYVNANSNESPDRIEQHSKANGLMFKVYKDAGNALADRLGASVTPETYVFDPGGTLLYHGYIDDSTNAVRVHVHGLRDAIEAVIAGRPVAMKEARSFGCTIKRVRKSS
jgi:thioredoxin-related protein